MSKSKKQKKHNENEKQSFFFPKIKKIFAYLQRHLKIRFECRLKQKSD